MILLLSVYYYRTVVVYQVLFFEVCGIFFRSVHTTVLLVLTVLC